MFRCCSLETSHPRLLPQSLNDCSINLCLFFCSAYRKNRIAQWSLIFHLKLSVTLLNKDHESNAVTLQKKNNNNKNKNCFKKNITTCKQSYR